MLKQRVLTAIVLILLVFGILFIMPMGGFTVVMVGLFILATWEWSRLMGLSYYFPRIIYTLLLLSLLFTTLVLPVNTILFLGVLFWLFAFYCVIHYAKTQRLLIKRSISSGLAGVFVLIPCWYGLLALRAFEQGAFWILALLLLIWAADSGAYFVGRSRGHRKLVPRVSPGKTVEGLWGGIIAALFVAIIEALLAGWHYQKTLMFIGVALVTVLFSVLGDLFESTMKRHQGLKDSGTLFPGHGGLLDRIDSLTAAAPVFALGVSYLGIAV